jgi:hypothetical protein
MTPRSVRAEASYSQAELSSERGTPEAGAPRFYLEVGSIEWRADY